MPSSAAGTSQVEVRCPFCNQSKRFDGSKADLPSEYECTKCMERLFLYGDSNTGEIRALQTHQKYKCPASNCGHEIEVAFKSAADVRRAHDAECGKCRQPLRIPPPLKEDGSFRMPHDVLRAIHSRPAQSDTSAGSSSQRDGKIVPKRPATAESATSSTGNMERRLEQIEESIKTLRTMLESVFQGKQQADGRKLSRFEQRLEAVVINLTNQNTAIKQTVGSQIAELKARYELLNSPTLGDEIEKHKSLKETSPDLVAKVASRLHEELLRPEIVTSLYTAAFQQLTEQLVKQQPTLFELLARLPLAFDFLDDELRYWKTTSEEIDPAIRGTVVDTLQKIQARVHEWQSRNHLERIPKQEQGEAFDWKIHAVGDKSVPAPSPELVDKIERVEQYGYRFGELPLRKAQVVVYSKNENGSQPAPGPTDDPATPPSASQS